MEIHDRTPDGGLAAERHRDLRGARARIRRRGRIRDGRRLHALPARPAQGRRARRRADPRAGDRRPDVHRPPRGRAAAGGHALRDTGAHQRRPVASLPAGLGPRPAPAARGRPRHAKGRLGRLGGSVQLLLLDRSRDRGHGGDLHAAAAFLRRSAWSRRCCSSSRTSTPSSAPRRPRSTRRATFDCSRDYARAGGPSRAQMYGSISGASSPKFP